MTFNQHSAYISPLRSPPMQMSHKITWGPVKFKFVANFSRWWQPPSCIFDIEQVAQLSLTNPRDALHHDKRQNF